MRRWVHAAVFGFALGASGLLAWSTLQRDALAEPPKEGWPPDPAPVATTKQWVFQIQSKQSVPSIVKVTELELKTAEATPRNMGRYALELYIGTEILDRLRFNVPLQGDGPPNEKPEPGKKRPVFNVNTKFFVRMADNPRASQLRLVDRATGEILLFAWPPGKGGKLQPWKSSEPEADAGDAGSTDAGSGDAGASDGGPSDAGDAGKFTPDGI